MPFGKMYVDLIQFYLPGRPWKKVVNFRHPGHLNHQNRAAVAAFNRTDQHGLPIDTLMRPIALPCFPLDRKSTRLNSSH